MAKQELPPLREIIKDLGLSARKSLGQNYILDLNITRGIAADAGNLEHATIVEIGPGPGGLTRALLEQNPKRLIVIERDKRFLPALEMLADHYPGKMDIRIADALDVDYADLSNEPLQIVANLPYNIATPLLVNWLKAMPWPPWYEKLHLMFQKEVADRIVSPPGQKSYGRLSVLAGWCCEARIVRTLPARIFTPSPAVDSAIVQLIPKPIERSQEILSSVEKVSAAIFGQRRKMLRQSLKQICKDPIELLKQADLEGSLRPEQLTIDQIVGLARILKL